MFKKCSLSFLLCAALMIGCSKGESPQTAQKTDRAGDQTASGNPSASQQPEKQTAEKALWEKPPMPESAAGTFVIVADVVFVRDDPKKVWPHESMTLKELQEAEQRASDSFPFPSHYFYYGENITGIRDKGNPDIVKTKIKLYKWEKGKQIEQGEKSGYIDIKKLWLEPIPAKIPTDRWMTIQDTDVYLAPDIKSRKVLYLLQGEVVECVGQLEFGGGLWIKAKFEYGRYGYIETKNLAPLYQDKIDQSHLTTSEIPKTMRYAQLSLSDKERERLARDGFYIESLSPCSNIYVDDMADLYNTAFGCSGTGSALFVTSDIYLHSFHLIFDRMLQNIEEEKIFPAIKSLTLKLVDATKKEIASAKKQDVKIEKALLHNLFFFSVTAKLFDPKFTVPQEVRTDVEAIVERIVKAEGPLPSLINKIELGDEDFTQYRVRGHYQKKEIHERDLENNKDIVEINDTLERYFRGMMWYGRHPLPISDDSKTLAAILMVRALENSGGFKDWERIDAVLTRLIGKTDDFTPRDYEKVNEIIFGAKIPKTEDIAKGGDKAIKAFQAKTFQILPKQKIVSMQTGTGRTQAERIDMTAGFKFLGQRFTWDAYIFNQLTSPSVGSDANPRNLPSSLDVMSILGSKAAGELQAGQKSDNYDSQIEKVKKEITGEIEKKDTSYNAWIYTLDALFSPAGSKQLFTLQSPWQFKELNSALGSWTELKHDTILYAKQSYAESGGGGYFEIPEYIPPYVKGYVEPNPIFFSRLLALLSSLRSNLEGGFLTDEYANKLQTFESLVKRAGDIAKKEIEGVPLTREDYDWIRKMANSLDRSLLLPGGIGDIIEPDYLKMALIADVATDAVSGQALEVAVGAPQRIVVVVKDAYGGTRITIGYVYSWYEFADTKRWTDTEWKKMVYSSDDKLIKLKPAWYSIMQK